MKFRALAGERRAGRSLPVRGAWVEMVAPHIRYAARLRRSPCGERGLKWLLVMVVCRARACVAPRAGSVG